MDGLLASLFARSLAHFSLVTVVVRSDLVVNFNELVIIYISLVKLIE